MWPTPPVGTLLAGRFTLESLAGRGGMGAVYRARDSLTGQAVALKLLHPATHSEAAPRFAREAELLSTLRHPGIVSHVAHGLTEHGQPFLAMEWLEGEDLAQRLARQPLSLPESLALLRRAAQALAVAHQRGIVHRDLKPSNLFLRHGRPEEVVLLDFGLARHLLASQRLTATAVLLGTPGYMAPEQASAHAELTPRADLFSLGCVLYECLAGQPPFSAPHLAAVLAKILFAEPTPLRGLRGDLPPGLEALVERLLAKDPSQRLEDAGALHAALEALEERRGPESPVPPLRAQPSRLAAEQQLVSVLLATPRPPSPEASTLPLPHPLEPTWQAPQQLLLELLEALRTRQAARVELLADGSLVATLLAGHGTATDQAAFAARCALALAERWPEATVVLATGLGVLGERHVVGEAM
jgi:serine/threonine protein kinase